MEKSSGIFYFCQFYWIFVFIYKNTLIAIKTEKVKNLKFQVLQDFCNFFLVAFTKFHVSNLILAQVITQNIILNKLNFCKKGHFCWNLPNVDRNFQNFYIYDFLVILHVLHLYHNFGCFNINIEDLIDKNSKKNTHYIYHIKVETPENWIDHIFGTELNFVIP